MIWILLAITAAFCWSISAYFDNYITDEIFKSKHPQSIKFFNSLFYLCVAILFLLFGHLEHLPLYVIMALLGAGVIGAFSSIPYYLALRQEETTSVAIFYQLVPIGFLLIDNFVLNQALTVSQLIGFALVLMAPLTIILSRRHKTAKFSLKIILLLLSYDVILIISGLLSTEFGKDYDYFTIFTFFLLGRGFTDFTLVALNPRWRQHFLKTQHRHPKRIFATLFTNQVFNIIGECTSRLSMIIGGATLANVVQNSSEMLITFTLGIIFSIFWPKFGREKLNRHTITTQFVATIFAIIGIIILS